MESGRPEVKTIFLPHQQQQQQKRIRRCPHRTTLLRRTSSYLPFEIQLNIISRLPVKLIVACKSLSKAFKASISEPFFTRIYHDNYYSSPSVNPIFINSSTMNSITFDRDKNVHLELVEFQRDAYTNDDPIITKCSSFSLAALPGPQVLHPEYGGSTIWGQCNGLFCLLKRVSRVLHLFLTNPLSGEFIELPNPIFVYETVNLSEFMMAYGLGYCQTTQRYKVLRMVTKYLGGGVTNYDNETEILTIGVDKRWRSVLDVNIPFNVCGRYRCNPQSDMVAFRSALHWLVKPIRMHDGFMIEPKRGARIQIAAFNLTEEKLCALPIPSKVHRPYSLQVGVLMDKLCLWNTKIVKEDIDIWIMDEYGVEGSWTKQFTLIGSRLPHDFLRFQFTVLSISVHDKVILVSNLYSLVFYDLKTNYSLMCIDLVSDYRYYTSYFMPFVPNFISFRNRQGWIAGVV